MPKPSNPEEEYLLNRLKDIYGSQAQKPTRSKHGDVSTPEHQWEHKFRSSKGFTVNWGHWELIEGRAALLGRDPVLVIKNSRGRRLAVMDLDDLLKLMLQIKELE